MSHTEEREDTQGQGENEITEFDKIKGRLEEYGLIMQACMEEAERTIKRWRGNPEVCLWNEEFWRMIPGISFALFEKVTRSADLEDDMKLYIEQMTRKSVITIYARYIDKILPDRKSEGKNEGAEP